MDPSPDAAVEVRGLSKRFSRVQAVENVSFSVNRGEIFGLVGPDGAGKTTTMRMLASVMKADAGAIRIDGVDVVAYPDRTKHHVSYMPQRFALYEDLTVAENIRFFADLFGIAAQEWRQRADRLLAASGMTPFTNRLAGQLSGGMKQKLGLTCALVHAPRVLLLDEPTTGVDPVSRREFWQILYSLRAEGVAMVISTAYLDEAERCDRLALMHQGQVMYCDTPQQLKRAMPGAIVHIVTDEARALLDSLRTLPGVLGSLLVGEGIHLHVDDGARRLPELQQAMQGRPVSSISLVEPSVEDLFVALLEQQETSR
jgi:ABC-2 type transport system ATP-binding protein